MFRQVLSTPRLLNTPLLHIDTTESQNVYSHSLAGLSLVRKEKTSVFINCVAFLCQYQESSLFLVTAQSSKL